MARTVYFSFHYQRDIFRVQQIKNHHITKGSYTQAGFFDGSLEEKAKTLGDQTIRRMIDDGMSGSSVLCLLIGQETSTRRWCYYETFRAIGEGMGVFGVRIHQLKKPVQTAFSGLLAGTGQADQYGANPLQYMRYYSRDTLKFEPQMYYRNNAWGQAQYADDMSWLSKPSFISSSVTLDNYFKVYDWVNDNGYLQFGNWVEAAARQVGR
jgi:MTH538 TIR-like domain (DUF1863).